MATFVESNIADELVVTLYRQRNNQGQLVYGARVSAATLAADGKLVRNYTAELWASLSSADQEKVQSLLAQAENAVKGLAGIA